MFGKGVYFADMVRCAHRRSTHPRARPRAHHHSPLGCYCGGCAALPQVSKSANYCGATRESPTAVLLLCDVALGKQYERIASEFEAAERSKANGKDSTWGIGKTQPRPDGSRTTADGVVIPMGQGADNEYLNAHVDELIANGAGKRKELLYNEFIVYDVSQIQMAYVVVCDVDFEVD